MKEQIILKLKELINKYNNNIYSKEEFQQALYSMASLITEFELEYLRLFLDEMAEKLEEINFLVDDTKKEVNMQK